MFGILWMESSLYDIPDNDQRRIITGTHGKWEKQIQAYCI
jgi:hypothetical protein